VIYYGMCTVTWLLPSTNHMLSASSIPHFIDTRFRWAHGERRTRDAKGVEFEAPRVETPNVSRGWGTGTRRFVGASLAPPAGSGAEPRRKTILMSFKWVCWMGIIIVQRLTRHVSVIRMNCRLGVGSELLIHWGNCFGNFFAVLALASWQK